MSEILHQATAVAIGERAVLIEGEPGSGKSSLALALIDRGAKLVGDDGVTLSVRDHALWAAPPPNTSGLLEIRNLGIVPMPCTEARVALVLRLDPDAPRHIDKAGIAEFLGVAVPLLLLWPDSPVLHLRAELALERYGT